MIRKYFIQRTEAQCFLFETREGYLIQILPFLLLIGLVYLFIRLAVRRLPGHRKPILWEMSMLLFILYFAGVFALWFVPRNLWRCLWFWAIFGLWDSEMVKDTLTLSFDLFPALCQVLAGEETVRGVIHNLLMGNLIMFLPFGLVTPFFLGEPSMGTTLKLGVLLTAIVEVARLVLGYGLTVENIALDLLCIGTGVCLYHAIRSNLSRTSIQTT